MQSYWEIAPLIVFVPGCSRASFAALAQRFAWYIGPMVQMNMRLKDFALATDLPSLACFQIGFPSIKNRNFPESSSKSLNQRFFYEIDPRNGSRHP